MTYKPKNFSEALEELGEKMEGLRPKLDEMKDKVGEEAQKAKVKVEAQVKENPWATLGIVGLIFFVLGFLFAGASSRRRD